MKLYQGTRIFDLIVQIIGSRNIEAVLYLHIKLLIVNMLPFVLVKIGVDVQFLSSLFNKKLDKLLSLSKKKL